MRYKHKWHELHLVVGIQKLYFLYEATTVRTLFANLSPHCLWKIYPVKYYSQVKLWQKCMYVFYTPSLPLPLRIANRLKMCAVTSLFQNKPFQMDIAAAVTNNLKIFCTDSGNDVAHSVSAATV